jgi:hypothetical protein
LKFLKAISADNETKFVINSEVYQISYVAILRAKYS